MGLLRLLLAFAVVIAHSAPLYGFVGIGAQAVPAFFIISGFYMNLVLATRYLRTRNGIRKFYFNRFIRLFPIYWVTVIIVLMLAMIPQSGSSPFFDRIVFQAGNAADRALAGGTPSLWAGIPNLLMIGSDILRLFTFSVKSQQLMLVDGSTYNQAGFIDLGQILIIPPIWSLGVELVCYLAVPFLSRLKTAPLAAIFFAATLIQYAWYAWAYSMSVAWSHLPFWYNAPYFILGMLAYRIYDHTITLRISFRIALSLIPFVIWGLYPTLTASFTRDWMMWAQWLIWLPYALAIPALFSLTKNSAVDGKIGDLSYPVYITHTLFAWPAVAFGSSQALVAIAASCIASLLLIRLVDVPVAKFKNRTTNLTPPGGSLTVGALRPALWRAAACYRSRSSGDGTG